MQFWQAIFIISCSIVFYNYAGYAILAVILTAFARKIPISPDAKHSPGVPAYTPGISFIVAAFNEQNLIREKILNSLEQDYPGGKIEFIFITDGSTDKTPGIVAGHHAIRLLHEPQRRGKSAAVNRAVREARQDILIFSDANTTLNRDAVRNIARHYADKRVGGVAGEKKVISDTANPDAPGEGEGMYWKYESRLKKIDSDLYSVVGAAGELFSLRKELYQPLPENTILDDFVLSLKAAEKGFRIIYEPQAYAMELPSFSLKDEQKRKIRIAAGGFQSIGMLRSLFLFWRHPRLSFLYISHRVLRWTLSPLCLILAFISNVILLFTSDNQLFKISFGLQLAFYGMALASRMPPLMKHKYGKIFKIPYYFTFMNVSVIIGFFRFLKGSQSAIWEKARRAEAGILSSPGLSSSPNKTWFARAFNTAVLQKSRMAWVDYLRGIAILLVVYRHALIGLERSNIAVPTAMVYANMIFYSFRMPLFFIISGIFINGSIARRPLKKLIFTKFENLLYPYLVWSFIQVTLQIILSRYTNAERTPGDYMFILYQPKALDQFWYLPALFNSTIVYLLLKTKLHVPNWLQLFIGLGFFLLAPHIHHLSMLSDWMEFYVFFALGDLLSVLFFRQGSQQFLKNPLTLLCVTPVFIATEVYYLYRMAGPGVGPFEFLAIALLGCFSMFVLAFRLQSGDILRFLRVLGFHSLFIYVMHVIVTAFARVILTKYLGLHNPEILLLCCIAVGVTLPIIFYNTLIKDNIFWFLLSLRKPAKKSPNPSVA